MDDRVKARFATVLIGACQMLFPIYNLAMYNRLNSQIGNLELLAATLGIPTQLGVLLWEARKVRASTELAKAFRAKSLLAVEG